MLDWRGNGVLLYELECLKCGARPTAEDVELLLEARCSLCSFRTWLRDEARGGTRELKDQAYARYREHYEACTRNQVPPENYVRFWGEISGNPPLGEPSGPTEEVEHGNSTILGKLIKDSKGHWEG